MSHLIGVISTIVLIYSESIFGVPINKRDEIQDQELGRIFKLLQKQADTLRTYEERMNKLENENRHFMEQLQDLEIRNLALKERINVLERQPLQESSHDTHVMSGDPSDSHVPEDNGTSQLGMFRNENELKLSRIRKVAPPLDNPVGFYALMTPKQIHLGANQAVQFDNVITNIGDAYDVRRSHFQAPVSGLYCFSASVLYITSTELHELYLEIVKNGAFMGYIYTSTSYDVGGRTVILSLSAGDLVWIRNQGILETVEGLKCSSFSGFLISPM